MDNLGIDLYAGGDIARYPHLFPPPGFTPFVRTGGPITVPAVAGTTVLDSIQITSNMEGWVRQIGLEAGDFSIISFRIQNDGAPLRDYTNISVPLGNVATPINVFIPISVNVPLQLLVISTGVAPVPVRYVMTGWYYEAKRG